jgi:hypothetical protein
LFHIFFFIVSHTAWVIIFTHGNKSSKLDKKVSFVGLWETTYTPVHASSYGHGPFYRAKIADARSGSLQWISATATERLSSAILSFELFLLSCQNVVGRWVLVIAVLRDNTWFDGWNYAVWTCLFFCFFSGLLGGRVMGNWVGVFIQYEGDRKGGCACHG